MKLGDAVASVTKALGFKECGGCAKRRAALNNVDLDRPASEVLAGILEAITNPPELNNGKKEASEQAVQEQVVEAQDRRRDGEGEDNPWSSNT